VGEGGENTSYCSLCKVGLTDGKPDIAAQSIVGTNCTTHSLCKNREKKRQATCCGSHSQNKYYNKPILSTGESWWIMKYMNDVRPVELAHD
jgi:hypothetical protein